MNTQRHTDLKDSRLLPSFTDTHADTSQKNIPIQHSQSIYTPRAQALYSDQFTERQTFRSSSNLSFFLMNLFCSNDSTRITRCSGKRQASSQKSLSYRYLPLSMFSKILSFSIYYRSIDLLFLPKTFNLLLTI
jgi:hypothetical protein